MSNFDTSERIEEPRTADARIMVLLYLISCSFIKIHLRARIRRLVVLNHHHYNHKF